MGSGEQRKKMNSIYNIWTSFEEKTGLREEQLMGLKITVGPHLTNYFFSNNSSILGLKILCLRENLEGGYGILKIEI